MSCSLLSHICCRCLALTHSVWQRIYDKIHAGVDESNFIRRALFARAYASKLEQLRNGDNTASIWDKVTQDACMCDRIDVYMRADVMLMLLLMPMLLLLWFSQLVFQKVADRFGGNIRLLSSGAAPLPSKVAEFMKM